VLVIGAGFGRTGTMSLKAGIEQLGFGPCYHGELLPGNRPVLRGWLAAAKDPEHADWGTVLAGYNSAIDWPVAAYWKELAAYFPEAKIILSVRDENRWYDSMTKTLFQTPLKQRPWERKWGARLVVATGNWLAPLFALVEITIYDRVFSGRFDRESAIRVFREHTEEVIATLPPERLLVWEPAQGWEPLCTFLEVPVPEGEFPHLNDAEAFNELGREMIHQILIERPKAKVTGLARKTAGSVRAVLGGRKRDSVGPPTA
jgi:hypothetical protein